MQQTDSSVYLSIIVSGNRFEGKSMADILHKHNVILYNNNNNIRV